ncbi:Sigma-70 region 2 [Trichormus variabilis ATCC 29413]|uniref:Sigma-70 region 2 n=2 Tax=Anabaena variabilis TaxID=264691 RepID=Q3M2U9_TRIV2|nr:sigma-70 family RNA polymerase sigma factor [Trichormus variabilis]ABA24687.1 Sigma-70 region 2 [Trichormus variabilis ATCC 29413]MBC1217724.1 sigma-70 family RNA polymerase sigma factor [Trichormus variabilis ARAD]MBC1258985.1 sigma-70 family RNA polymerase sigma factor [Trichormus variabilis V5]MBC1302696.1 sigma-70 family RNA polymerase sigma factor [Trichormus variabilis N2B]MBC1324551.1 sigma-70 family RNA polymerase sigma factor [Trichormus variabilis 9RC]
MTTELFREYRNNPTRQLRDRIFNHHYKLACEIAHQYRICCDEPLEDLIQLAGVGMLTAIERFDPSRSNAFSSFACPYIKGEIRHYLRDKASTVKIPRSLQSLYQRGKKLHGTDEQIAKALGCTQQQWKEAKAIGVNRNLFNIDNLLTLTLEWSEGCGGSDTVSMKRFLSALSFQEQPVKPIATTIEPSSLSQLDEANQQLIEMFFFQNEPLKEVKRTAIASGKGKDVKTLLVNAVLMING